MSDTLSGDSESLSSATPSAPATPPPSNPKHPSTMETDTQLTCSICKKRYSDPHLLPCLHTFCSACLKTLSPYLFSSEDHGSPGSTLSSIGSGRSSHRSVAIHCPTCDLEVDLPSKGPELLPVNFMIKKQLMLESLKPESGETICDLCTDNAKAVSRCMECMVNVCGFCIQAHKRQRKTANHSVLSLHEARCQGAASLSSPVMCPKHPQEELKMYCETCDQSVCRDCCLVQHREHLVEYSEDVVHHHKRVLENLVARLQPHVQAIGGGINSINRSEVSIADRSTELHHDINSYFDNYIQALQAHRRSLLSHVSKVGEGRIKSLQVHRLQLQQLLRDMQHSCNVTTHALSDSNSQEVLALKPTLGHRLSELNHVSYQCTPRVDNALRFKSRAKAGRVNGYEVHGMLEVKQLDPLKCYVTGEGVHEARQGMISEFLLIIQDIDGQPYNKGGEDVRATLAVETVRNRVLNCSIFDEDDGSYRIEYTPQVHATHMLCVFLDGQHVKGSPFRVTVHEGWREHAGIWHCCTFCSSEGSRQATCACGGKMPGGFKGCGHGHPGHPGKWHWSCCALTKQDSECIGQRPLSSPQGARADAGAGIAAGSQPVSKVTSGTLVKREPGPLALTGASMGHGERQGGSGTSGAETMRGKGRDKQVHTISL
ncbi:tripartite motif-containing protein 45-like [Patiria miniata]|uniref:Tripartite motif-containing protein 45 n=1 Tax=Patiria miniata TaxID=46514 RepID=A0A914AHX1_PATMI|nr:tripartite motif-containing protein 45-like [Patiria miniata]XP_038063604.1 tripartite motif-containing protein 45-like [Patiria miniata]XP_038063605.1 tripartite motif-containing protein 45-like [Patiria miniata]XP_038063606.1 tripartite motif-containing protein 45-like [Patiria miniata]